MARKVFPIVPNFRFWQWINDGWVKLTLRPGRHLRWHRFQRTDEGWSSTHEDWLLDGETVLVQSASRGRDCDGRLDSYWSGTFDVRHGRFVPDFRYPDDLTPVTICRPDFIEVSREQRDHSAEAMGY